MKQYRLSFWCMILQALLAAGAAAQGKPNIVFILADDLGYRSIGAFGQKMIHTPNIDRMAKQGIVLTNFYANALCSPTRASLITGMNTSHGLIRDNYDVLGGYEDSTEFGQMALPPNGLTLGTVLQSAGYRTGVFGKWGLGGPHSTGVPWKQGIDEFYGYLDQKQAHNYYPTHLWRNEFWEKLPNPVYASHQQLGDKDPDDPASYQGYKGTVYSCDTITSEALKFMKANRTRPFFMYMAYTLPHMSLQAPDKWVNAYASRFEEKPYKGGYLPNRTPHATYAAMITLLDDYVGRLLEALKELKLDKNTLVIFTGDNGAAVTGGVDADYFNCSGELRGRKGNVFEGGIREPFVAYWPGKIKPGTSSDHLAAIWDLLPTFAELGGVKRVKGTDGISLLPVLLGNAAKQEKHEFLYWEVHQPMHGVQAVRFGNWKAVRKGIHDNPDNPIELYNLKEDPSEKNDRAKDHPELLLQAQKYFSTRELGALPEWNSYHPQKSAVDN